MFRRKRYATIVISLLTLVFVGVGTVVSLMTLTTFRPLPFANPEQLVTFLPLINGGADPWQADTLALTTHLVPQLTAVASYSAEPASTGVSAGAVTKQARVIATSPNFFDVLRMRLEQPNAAATYAATPGGAIITRQLVTALGLDPREVLGKSVRLFDRPVTIVGVIDRTRAFPTDADVWLSDARRGPGWLAIGRTSSPADIMELSDKLSLAAHQVYGGAVRVTVFVRPLTDAARPSMATEQRGLSAGIVVFAIIAILNYALLGIGEARRRGQEFAIRVALGATRRQVASRFLIEQLRLIGAAALATFVVFMIGRAAFPTNDVFLPSIGLVPGSIWLMIAAAFSILVLAAALPSRIASATGEAETLRQVAARSSRFERTWNRAFIGMQFAVTGFLLVAGGSAAMAFMRTQSLRYGFDPNDAVFANVSFHTPALQGDAQAKQAAFEIATDLRQTMPGAPSTAWGTTFRGMTERKPAFMIDAPNQPQTATAFPFLSQDVLPNFFDVLRIPIVAGRAFRDADDEGAEPVVIVSRTAARKMWGTPNVLGRHLLFNASDTKWMTVVGVSADAQPVQPYALNMQLSGIDWPLISMYRPLRQNVPHSLAMPRMRFENGRYIPTQTGISVLVRTGPRSDNTAAKIQAIFARNAPGEKLSYLGPFARFLDGGGEIERGRFTTRLLTAFSIAGFGLAIFGAICLIDEVVRRRTNEIGIRRALGAQSANLVVLASQETFLAGAAGVIAGVFAGARLGSIVAVWMKGSGAGSMAKHTDTNWMLIVGAAAVPIVLLAIFTSWRAVRAARLDPMVALRVT